MKLYKRRTKEPELEADEPPKNIRISRPASAQNDDLTEAQGVHQERSERRARLVHRMKRAARMAAWCVFIAGLVTASITLGRSFEEFVRSSPSFAIRAIEIEGNTQLSDEEILAAAGLELGQNIFEFKGEEIEARLRQHPALRGVQVERILPGRFTIWVEEYRPIALLALDELYLLSREGIAYRPLADGEAADLPIISLAEPSELIEDRALRQRLLFEAASIIDAIDRHGGELLNELMEIHIRADHRFVLRFFDERMDVFLGRGDYPTKLERLRAILDELGTRSLRASRVHIDNEQRPERAIVRLKLSEAAR